MRLAVFERTGTQRIPLGIAAVLKNDDGGWTLQGHADLDSARDRIRFVLESYAAKRRASATAHTGSQPDFVELSAVFREAGYEVDDISAGDYQITFQLDLESGGMVATHAATHDAVAHDGALGQRIFDAIATSLAKPVDDLANELDALFDQNEVGSAVTAFKSAAEQGVLSLPPSNRLLNVLVRFDVATLPPDESQFILEGRAVLAHRLNRFEIASRDAEILLKDHRGALTEEKVVVLRMTVALGAISKGHRETGLSILRDLLKPPNSLGPDERGWAWRNIAMTLDRSDPEAARAARLSADSFLEAGQKKEAGKSLMHLADLLIDTDPSDAISRLDEMITILERDGVFDRHVRAAALHARANRLARMNEHARAFEDAVEAVTLRRGLLGNDESFVSSLHLAAQEAMYLGDTDAAENYRKDADALTEERGLRHFQLAQRVEALAQDFNATEAEAIFKEAETDNNLEILAGVRVIQALGDASLTDTKRLDILEEASNRIASARGGRGMIKLVHLAIAQLLTRQGQFDRAERWYREVLNHDAFDRSVPPALVNCLWRQEKWGDAVIFIREQLGLFGEVPGVNLALGKSLFEAGDMSGAVTTLTKLLASNDVKDDDRKNAHELRERALQAGGTILRPPVVRSAGAVTREEFEISLEDFAQFIAAEKRMRFWVRDAKGGHKWVAGPEGRAQDLLHTFLKARYGDRVEIFEEIATGAGRLDLYIKLEGGLAIVVELKMCGVTYSSEYASSGSEQIKHYMDNRKTHLGYLVVFDARVSLFGQKLLVPTSGPHTVVEKIIDVRSKVK